MTPYQKLLCECARYEVEVLKKQKDVKFVLNKEKLNPISATDCIYGQMFVLSSGIEATEFKENNGIIVGFTDDCFSGDEGMTALEQLTYNLWEDGKKGQAYKIIEQFATWKGEETRSNDLFTI